MLQRVDGAEVYWPELSAKPVPCLAFVTSERVITHVEWQGKTVRWADHKITGGELPAPNRGTLQGQIHLVTDAGEVHISKGRGCGCHNPLRAVGLPVPW
jgi:hypothetical protein